MELWLLRTQHGSLSWLCFLRGEQAHFSCQRRDLGSRIFLSLRRQTCCSLSRSPGSTARWFPQLGFILLEHLWNPDLHQRFWLWPGNLHFQQTLQLLSGSRDCAKTHSYVVWVPPSCTFQLHSNQRLCYDDLDNFVKENKNNREALDFALYNSYLKPVSRPLHSPARSHPIFF